MLKLIPQEQPEKDPRKGNKPKKKKRAKSQKRAPQQTANHQAPTKKEKDILAKTSHQLQNYSSQPEKHTDREIADIILSMHRSILHLQKTRQANHKKRKNKRGRRNK